MSIEGYDLVMLGILAVTALLGYFKGMVWQLAWIAGIVASSFVSLKYGTVAAPYFGQQEPWNRFAAMLALYAGTSLVVWLVFRLVSGVINAIHLSAFDHQLGLLFGLAKGALLCVVVTFFAVMLAPAYRQQIVSSRSGRIVAQVIVQADTYLPKELQSTVDPFVKQFEQQFQQPGTAPFGGASAGQPQAVAGQGASPLQAFWNGVSSSAAWAGAEQGGGSGQGTQQAGGLPAGTSWFVPRGTAPAGSTQPAGYQAPVTRPSTSSFSSPPTGPPQPFPMGAQSPLPVR